MHNAPIEYGKPPVEAKVKWASLGGFLGSVGLLAVLQAVDADHSLIAWWPDWAEAVTIPLLPTAIGAVAGWKAKHTARPDLPVNKR
ncbi:holin [Nonomuraea rhodomycinica]|uniref:Holin n=1 Tax=Nonomuraea rhodomycinica TaxID=1712872 RepID=A0A7Y6MG51_9ACTN|nr:holin [Nonomuraea rhodomycinica]NUW45529.1 holin [Nonomuraea rhodomycinica]